MTDRCGGPSSSLIVRGFPAEEGRGKENEKKKKKKEKKSQ